jgi:hypothetical protein
MFKGPRSSRRQRSDLLSQLDYRSLAVSFGGGFGLAIVVPLARVFYTTWLPNLILTTTGIVPIFGS